jgi:hypothetical protein
MKFNPWTLGLAAAGVISLPLVTQAEEAQHQVMTALSSTTLSGYVDTSAIWNIGTGKGLVGRSYDGAATKQDGFNLNVVKLQLDKPLDEGQWSAGYRVGLLFGPDANTLGTQSLGGTPDFGVKDAYVTLRAPVGTGLDVQMGVFDSPLAYEAFEAGSNPNYSRSFGYSLEPHTLTGLQVSYRVHESVLIRGGVANTGGNAINARVPASVGPGLANSNESLKTYFGAISITAPESAGFLKGSTIEGGVMDVAVAKPGSNQIHYFASATVPLPVEGLSLGAAYDYAANTLAATGPSHASSVAGYLTYQATEKMKLALRSEYANGGTGAFGVAKGIAENVSLMGNTATVDYSLWANVISRLEFRWDHALNGQRYFGAGNHKNSFSVALNVIYKF